MNNVIYWKEEEAYRFLYEREQIVVTEKEYLFSLVMAMYNSADFIKETLQSILSQTIGFEENIQLILVDDGSTDDTYKICKGYAEKYPENIVLIQKPNGGVSSARNVGVRFATGKYINFIDSDDKFSDNVCACVSAFFDKYENKVDVVTIKNELFGEKTGDSWFNNKFRKGTRLINLWAEPQIYLNSTNNSFFHKRILNQLHFDEGLSIAEDLKMVNLALMNKWALGVISECTYYYRIRSGEDASLAMGARSKEYYYLPYLEKVFFALFDFATKRCKVCPDYLQYTLLRDLWNRFNNNTECAVVLQSEEVREEYKRKLFEAISLIDDHIITKNSFLRSDEQVYFLSIKYGRPTLQQEDSAVIFSWESTTTTVKKSLFAGFEKADVSNGVLTIEGYAVINNVRIPFDDYGISCFFGENECDLTEVKETSNDNLAFCDEKTLLRRYFIVKIHVTQKKPLPIRLFLRIQDQTFPISIIGYGKWFALSEKFSGEYYQKDHVFLTIKDHYPVAHKGNLFTAMRYEKALIRSLKQVSPANKKIIRLRRAYRLFSHLPHRPIWIVSDRKIAAGDNGQAFYEYVKKKLGVNTHFALMKDSSDYAPLKKKHFRLLDLNSRKYKLYYLLSDVLISAHFDGVELEPIAKDGIHDIIAKKHFVFLQHGITKDDVSQFYSRKRQNLDLFITAAKEEYNSIIRNVNYFCDETRTALTGFPRYDKLYDDERHIVLFMPTWRNGICVGNKLQESKFLKSYYYNFYHALLSDPRLQESAEKNGYKLVYFSHFNIAESNEYMKDIPNVVIPTPEERVYLKAFATASLMVTDYSSTAFDFAYLRKPIVYCQGDKDEFFAHHTYTKGYFEYELDGFGPVTYDVEGAVKEIVSLMEKGCAIEENYLARINDFFPFHDKKNSARVYKSIRDMLKGEKK